MKKRSKQIKKTIGEGRQKEVNTYTMPTNTQTHMYDLLEPPEWKKLVLLYLLYYCTKVVYMIVVLTGDDVCAGHWLCLVEDYRPDCIPPLRVCSIWTSLILCVHSHRHSSSSKASAYNFGHDRCSSRWCFAGASQSKGAGERYGRGVAFHRRRRRPRLRLGTAFLVPRKCRGGCESSVILFLVPVARVLGPCRALQRISESEAFYGLNPLWLVWMELKYPYNAHSRLKHRHKRRCSIRSIY